MDKLDLNMKEVHKELVDFLKENFKKNGFSKAVLGLSGGIDSALAAYLLKDALGKENVLAIMMPYKSSNPDSLNHAKLVVENIVRRMNRSEYKRKMPLIAKIKR